MPLQTEPLRIQASMLCKRAEALQQQAVSVSKMNPLLAANNIKALVLEACSAMKALSEQQYLLANLAGDLEAEISLLREQLAGYLPKGGCNGKG